ncbi:MAG: putative secreted metalloprotease [Nitrospira sp.]|nr:putative secreted metalloprotease [Nitrospira sp.]
MSTPFVNEEFTFTNPDGSTVQVRGMGNQHYAVFETLDGYTVVKDPATGFYMYGKLSEDKNDLVPTDAKVGDVDPQSLGLRPHIRIRRESARQKALRAPMLQEPPSRWQVRRAQKKSQLRGIAPTTRPEALPQATIRVGTYVGLCVLIRFPDVAETLTQQEVNDFCNLPGYNGFGNNGSVRDYFYDNSRGKLTYTNVVTQYYTAAHKRSYYTDPAISFGTRARELVVEALTSLKSQGFNFGQLSSDSGGYIYALNVFYVGPTVNNWSEGLWPHSWSLASPYDAGAGKKFSDYQITNMGSELTLRTFCHENGHMICDFPDLYDKQSNYSAGVGHYCLMCYGGNNKNPAQIGAYLKNEAGWATKATPVTPGLTATLSAAHNDFYIYTKSATEYFIVENRQKTGRDTFLPDAGLAIWHVDEQGSNNNEQMTPSQHYECSLLQADNRFDLEGNINLGDSEDLFGSPNNTQFSDTTSPDSKWWDGSNSGLKIAQISAPAATMTFVVPAGITWQARPRTPNTIVARFPEHLDVFAVASDGRTMSNWWDQSTGWAGWFHVQGGISSPGGSGSPVTAVARYAHHLDLFTVGTDNRVYSAWWDITNGWHGWFPIGNLQCRSGSTVNVVSRNSNHLDLFTTAADGRTMSTWWDVTTGWADWFQVQGGVASPGATVTAIARYPNHLDLFTVGTDQRVYSCWWDEGSGWHNWFVIGNLQCRSDSTVSVVARFSDQLDLFTTAADGRIMSTWWNAGGGWGGWFQVSGGVASPGSSVTAIARYPNHLDLFTIGTDNRIYSTWWHEGQNWANWFNVSSGVGKPGGQVAAISRVADHIDLVTVGSDGGVFSTWWNGATGWAGWFPLA